MGATSRRQKSVDDPALAPRRAAVALVSGVVDGKRQLSGLVEAASGPVADLEPSGRARAQRLAKGTLRNLGALDWLLKPMLRKRPPELVRNVLRLASYELCVEGAAAHGAVNSAVALVREASKRSELSGLTNAVLRRVAEEGIERWPKRPPERLPNWLRGRLQSAYGARRVAAIEKVHSIAPPLDLTAKPGKSVELAVATGGLLLQGGSVRVDAGTQVSHLPGFSEGDWWVQDAASAVPARALAPSPGMRVLDLCAAPGGKTLQLAATGAAVTAVDSSHARMVRLRENLERTGLSANCVVADIRDWQSEPFDAVLMDAPCSATGTIRRHPDLPYVRVAADLAPLIELQSELLDKAVSLTRPGGRLVYCTCSLLPDEGEKQVAAALQRHTELAREPVIADDLPPDWITAEGDIRITPDLWPENGGIDGFYVGLMTRRGA